MSSPIGIPGWPWAASPDPIEGADTVRVLVMCGYGLNCEAETAAGFRRLGATVELEHVSDVIEKRDAAFSGRHIVVFVGGFSFGDHIASGRVFANRLRFQLGAQLARHVDDGGLVLGICNGFQTLVKMGLLPAVGRKVSEPLMVQQASLVSNDRLGYRNAWVRLVFDRKSPCVFTRGFEGTVLEVPSRHGEGKLVISEAIAPVIEERHLIPVRYADAEGRPTERWPDNPNGSVGGAAGLCDESGRIFGLMPHPEAYLYPENHPHWRLQRDAGTLPPVGLGLGLLAGGVRAVLAR